jgi:hypothetical protein
MVAVVEQAQQTLETVVKGMAQTHGVALAVLGLSSFVT